MNEDKTLGFIALPILIFATYKGVSMKINNFFEEPAQIPQTYQPESYNWQPIADAGYWFFIMAAILGTIYLIYIAIRKFYYEPKADLDQRPKELEKNIPWLCMKVQDISQDLVIHTGKTEERYHKRAKFLKDLSRYTGYEDHLKSQRALNDFKKNKS